MSDLEGSECSCALGVDDTLGNPLAVKVGNDVQEVSVLEEDGTARSDGLAAVVVIDRAAQGGGHTSGILF